MKFLKIAFLSVFTLLSTQAHSEEKYTSITCYQEGKEVIFDLKLKDTDYFKSEGVIVITGINQNNKKVRLVGLACSFTDY